MSSVAWVFGSIAMLYVLIMIPIQYSYISSLKDRQKRLGASQGAMYQRMSFEEEQLHFHMQGNLLNWPSAIIADSIYKMKHRKAAS